MIRPTITVIIPNYNNILYFPKAYKSVKNQTKAPHEIIIICDETNIKAFQFIKNITKGDKRTIVIQNKKNRGVSYSRNLGIKKAKGDYIAFLDSDDVWDKRKLEFQLRLMRKNKSQISHTSYKVISEEGIILGKFKVKKNMKYSDLLKSCDIGTSTVMVKKSLIKNMKFPNLNNQEDYCLWLKISKKHNFLGIKKILSSWRRRKNSLSGNNLLKLKNAFLVYNRYMKQTKFSSFVSLLRLVSNNIKKKIEIYVFS